MKSENYYTYLDFLRARIYIDELRDQVDAREGVQPHVANYSIGRYVLGEVYWRAVNGTSLVGTNV